MSSIRRVMRNNKKIYSDPKFFQKNDAIKRIMLLTKSLSQDACFSLYCPTNVVISRCSLIRPKHFFGHPKRVPLVSDLERVPWS